MSAKAKLTLKVHKKTSKLYNVETGLVFNNATDKSVVGRIVDDEFIAFDSEALRLCEENGYKYDKSLVSTEETEEVVEEPEEVVPEKTSVKEVPAIIETKNLTSILNFFSKEVTGLIESKDAEINSLNTRMSDLQKELEDVKKKLKGVLAALQSSL
jgi:flagellar capping protein FliD